MLMNTIQIIAGASIFASFFAIGKIDSMLKKANVDREVNTKVNGIMVLLSAVNTILSLYILIISN